jgi:hypothetical protein
MNTVKRYQAGFRVQCDGQLSHLYDSGEFVSAADYDALRAELADERKASASHFRQAWENGQTAADLRAELDSANNRANAAIRLVAEFEMASINLKKCPRTHSAADAFWDTWKKNNETHKHGYYESTWLAVDAAMSTNP